VILLAGDTMDLTLDYIITNRHTLLAELNQKQGIVRDYARSVARQYSTGLYPIGRPCTAKTHTVRQVLGILHHLTVPGPGSSSTSATTTSGLNRLWAASELPKGR